MALGSTWRRLLIGVIGEIFLSSAGEEFVGEEDARASHALASRIGAWRVLFWRVKAREGLKNLGKFCKILLKSRSRSLCKNIWVLAFWVSQFCIDQPRFA